jgi:hypothetical protein
MSNNSPQTGQVNVANLNNAAQQTLIHIDLNKTFYSITPSELDNIEEGSSSIWKDITLTGLGIGIPCCVNAIIENNKSTTLNTEIFWNSLIAGISITVSIIFAIIWLKSNNKCKKLISEIKQRPQYKMP